MKPKRVPMDFARTLPPDQWVLERKYDGHRAMVVLDGGVSLWTRDRVRTEAPTNVRAQLEELRIPDKTVLDAELWNPLKRGSWRHNPQVQCVLSVWDAVVIGGKDVGGLPLEDRRRRLEEAVAEASHVRLVEQVPCSPEAIDQVLTEAREFRKAEAIRSGFIHGVVLKKLGSPRRDTATRCKEHPDWLKVVFDGMKGWEHRRA